MEDLVNILTLTLEVSTLMCFIVHCHPDNVIMQSAQPQIPRSKYHPFLSDHPENNMATLSETFYYVKKIALWNVFLKEMSYAIEESVFFVI